MDGDKEQSTAPERIVYIVASGLGGLISTVASSMLSTPLPIGFLAMLTYMFYKKFRQNPFSLSREDLERHIIEARLMLDKKLAELEKIKKIKERVENGEIGGDLVLLDARIRQLEEEVELARAKIRLANMIMMVRESIDLFNKLYGRENFNKLITNIDKLNEEVEKILKRSGIDEVDVESFYRYFERTFPLITRGGTADQTALPPQQPQQPVQQPAHTQQPRPTGFIEVDVRLLREGEPIDWLKVLEEAASSSAKIRLPSGTFYTRQKGYRSLLIALFSTDLDLKILKGLFDNRRLNEIALILRKLREGDLIEVSPTSSENATLEELISIMCIESVRSERSESVIIRVCKFADAENKEVLIERRVVIDPNTKRATKIIYKTVRS
jgi:hypothetical protein